MIKKQETMILSEYTGIYDLVVPKVSFLPNIISDSKLLRYDAAKALEKISI